MKNQAQKLKILEWAFWPLFFFINDYFTALSVVDEHERRGDPIGPWDAYIWEFSSGLMLIALVPFIIWVDRRFPLKVGSLKKVLGIHFLLTIPFSLIHVGGMIAIRKAVYALNDGYYGFGALPRELFYEYRKDLLTYFGILAVLYGYSHFRYRYFEASLDMKPSSKKPFTRVLIKTGSKETFLKVDEIERLEASGNYVNIHAKGARHFLRSTLAQLEDKLPSDKFVRVHRSNIVNLDHIKEMIPTPSGDARIIMEGGDHVSLSRRFRDRLKALEI